MISKLRTVSIISLLTIGLFLAVEFSLGYLLPLNRSEMIYKALEKNREILWKVRPELDIEFFGSNLKTNSLGFRKKQENCEEGKRTLGLFGASPSFGWGVSESETYLARLEKSIGKKEGICFKNFSNIGYSSTQGRRLFENVLKNQKIDYAIITYMVNDLDHIRFFFEDEFSDELTFERLRNSSGAAGPEGVLSQLNFIRASNRLAEYLKPNKEEPIPDYKKWPGQRRVEGLELLNNHSKMIALAKEKGIKLYYVRLPIGLKFFYNRYQNECKVAPYAQAVFEKTAERFLNKNFGLLPKIILDLKKCPYHFQGNYLSLLALQIQNEDKLKITKQYADFERSGAIYAMAKLDEYDQALQELLQRHDIPHSFLELPRSEDELKKFFIEKHSDFVHPSASGHAQISIDLSSPLSDFLKTE